MEEIVSINPDEHEYLAYEPTNSLNELQDKLKTKEGQLEFAKKGVAGAITLVARGLVKPEDEEEILLLAIQSEELERERFVTPTAAKHLQLFKETVQDAQKRKAFIEKTNEALTETNKFAHSAASRFFTKSKTLFEKWGANVEVENTKGKIAFLTVPEIQLLLEQVGYVAAHGNNLPAEFVIDTTRDTAGKVVSRLLTEIKFDDTTGIALSFSYNKNTLEHEVIHLLAQQSSKTKVYTPEGTKAPVTVVSRGFMPKAYKLDGEIDTDETLKLISGTKDKKQLYDLKILDEAATTLIHAVLEGNWTFDSAENVLSRNTVGTFDSIENVQWALKLVRKLHGVTHHEQFIKRYVAGDLDGFISDLEDSRLSLYELMWAIEH